MKKILIFIAGFVLLASPAMATTVMSENFNDRAYSSPLNLYGPSGYDTGVTYDSSNAQGGSGYCVRRDDSKSHVGGCGDPIFILSNIDSLLSSGVYIRYWLKFASNYDFQPAPHNEKLMKIAGSAPTDIEWIFSADNGSAFTSIRYQYGNSSGGTTTGSANINFTRGTYHKIEIYLYLPSSGTPRQKLQIDDKTVWDITATNVIRSGYNATKQFYAVRASNLGCAASGQGYAYVDNLTIVNGEGDLTSNEPPEPDGSISADPGEGTQPPNPPTGLKVMSTN